MALVTVRAGEDSRCSLVLPATVERTLRLPRVSGDWTIATLSIERRAASDHAPNECVSRATWYYSNTANDAEWVARFAPGSYRLSLALQGGPDASRDAVVDARDAPEEVIELAVPPGW
jgi:hypothetical protein